MVVLGIVIAVPKSSVRATPRARRALPCDLAEDFFLLDKVMAPRVAA
jgi:hypothetical protein